MNNTYNRLLDLVVNEEYPTSKGTNKSGRRRKPRDKSMLGDLGPAIKRVEREIGAKPRPEPTRPPKPVKKG